jgi:hypothetical protein
MSTQQRLSILLAALWWGSLSGLGFVFVPMLFVHLDSPATAGAMAAKLFSAQTWLSTGCAFLLLLVFNKKDDAELAGYAKAAMGFVVAGLLLALLVEFGIGPRIVSARTDGGNLRLWHALGSAMYLAQWLAAGWTLWCLSRSSRAGAA